MCSKQAFHSISLWNIGFFIASHEFESLHRLQKRGLEAASISENSTDLYALKIALTHMRTSIEIAWIEAMNFAAVCTVFTKSQTGV